MIDMKAEKYVIFIELKSESSPATSTKVRYGFGAAGEEVQKLLGLDGLERIRVKIDGRSPEVAFQPGRPIRLLDIKQRIKSLSFEGA